LEQIIINIIILR